VSGIAGEFFDPHDFYCYSIVRAFKFVDPTKISIVIPLFR